MASSIENMVRLHVTREGLETVYRHMAEDEVREVEAIEFSEATISDVAEEDAIE